jgi:hypothetical protein
MAAGNIALGPPAGYARNTKSRFRNECVASARHVAPTEIHLSGAGMTIESVPLAYVFAAPRLIPTDPAEITRQAAQDRAIAIAAWLHAIGSRFSLPSILQRQRTQPECRTPRTTNT